MGVIANFTNVVSVARAVYIPYIKLFIENYRDLFRYILIR